MVRLPSAKNSSSSDSDAFLYADRAKEVWSEERLREHLYTLARNPNTWDQFRLYVLTSQDPLSPFDKQILSKVRDYHLSARNWYPLLAKLNDFRVILGLIGGVLLLAIAIGGFSLAQWYIRSRVEVNVRFEDFQIDGDVDGSKP